jgi:hypothetical protein
MITALSLFELRKIILNLCGFDSHSAECSEQYVRFIIQRSDDTEDVI